MNYNPLTPMEETTWKERKHTWAKLGYLNRSSVFHPPLWNEGWKIMNKLTSHSKMAFMNNHSKNKRLEVFAHWYSMYLA